MQLARRVHYLGRGRGESWGQDQITQEQPADQRVTCPLLMRLHVRAFLAALCRVVLCSVVRMPLLI